MKFIAYTTVFAVSVVVCALVSGWTLSTLWSWFVVPKFGLPSLSVPDAIGLSLVAGCFKAHRADKDDREFIEIVMLSTFMVFMWAPLALLIGSVVRHWT